MKAIKFLLILLLIAIILILIGCNHNHCEEIIPEKEPNSFCKYYYITSTDQWIFQVCDDVVVDDYTSEKIKGYATVDCDCLPSH